MAQKKIFVGPHDISSQVDDWKKGFGLLGQKVLFVSNAEEKNVAQASRPDIDYYRLRNLVPYFRPGRISVPLKKLWNKKVDQYIMRKLVKECDIFIFIWSAFKNDFSDIEYLKKKNKKIVFFFVGDDVRWYQAMKQEFEHYGIPPINYADPYVMSDQYRDNVLSYLRQAEKHADIIFSHPIQSQLALRPYYRNYVMIDLKKFRHHPRQNKIPLIIHAPTTKEGKGTKYVLEAVEKLRKDGMEFEFKLLHGIPYQEIIKEYEACDMLIGQLLSPGGGKQERELLAMGKVVLTSVNYSYNTHLTPNNCPMVDVLPDTLYDVAKRLIPDHERRQDIALRGRAFVEKYHDPKNVCERVLALLDTPEEQRDYDVVPDFFRSTFVPESEEGAAVYNAWTKEVAGCDWYRKYVKQGKRDGLVF